jgi:hypothetical protein
MNTPNQNDAPPVNGNAVRSGDWLGEPADTKTSREERRWWEVDYRHITKRPDWFRLRECHRREDVEPLVKYWTGRDCDVRVTAAVEVVTRTVTRGQPQTSSPSD